MEFPAPGVLQFFSAKPARDRLVVSVGVHGDESAPIALLGRLLRDIGQSSENIVVDLMVVVANLPAIREHKRYIDQDLNRLFRPLAGSGTGEASRAAELQRIVSSFLAGTIGHRVHLDLHSTIKPSLFPNFAVVPHSPESAEAAWLTSWLGQAGMEAAIYSDLPSSTFSAFTARNCAAAAATLEMGMRGDLGRHSLSSVAMAAEALQRAFTQGLPALGKTKPLQRFRVVQEIVRRTESFRLNLSEAAPNFTRFDAGEVIAADGEEIYCALESGARIVFPNAQVPLGSRAGIIVQPMD